MKSYLLRIRPYIFMLFIAIICLVSVHAQDDPVINYLKQAGDYTDLYNGKMEAVYNITQYKSFPYYVSSDYTDATIVYRNNPYPNQRVRLDLYKEQLILLPAEKQFGIIAGFENVEKVYMYNKIIVKLIPPKGSGLKQGYYIQLFDKGKIKLYCKEYFIFEQKIENREMIYRFERNVRHYLSYNDRYYQVKNKGSFSKIFPQFKKQINKFAKDNKLDTKQNLDESLTALAGYCEELITSTKTQ